MLSQRMLGSQTKCFIYFSWVLMLGNAKSFFAFKNLNSWGDEVLIIRAVHAISSFEYPRWCFVPLFNKRRVWAGLWNFSNLFLMRSSWNFQDSNFLTSFLSILMRTWAHESCLSKDDTLLFNWGTLVKISHDEATSRIAIASVGTSFGPSFSLSGVGCSSGTLHCSGRFSEAPLRRAFTMSVLLWSFSLCRWQLWRDDDACEWSECVPLGSSSDGTASFFRCFFGVRPSSSALRSRSYASEEKCCSQMWDVFALNWSALLHFATQVFRTSLSRGKVK